MRGGDLASVAGRIREVEAIYREGVLVDLRIEGEGAYEIDRRTDVPMRVSNEAVRQLVG